ncbi:MAG: [FeFe] hydrogenase H-cluster radical SAM maturase HydE [Phycisphaerae bacterium]|nr:[FeFe] hydrogenase H-cluster radical SAM maturase HydE [Phycisphaerae bacterium]
MNRQDILTWLRERDERQLEQLYRQADVVRADHVGDDVHLRGLIEISSHCLRSCAYCGLRRPNQHAQRYRMSRSEILESVELAVGLGYGTVVLQSGQDHELTGDFVVDLIRQLKSASPLAVTLSLGERSLEELAAWRAAGADRYLLRFETSNRALYERIHPPLGNTRSDRIALLGHLRKLGYEIGGGVMVGIPGQTYEDLATDIETFRELDLDMIGIGPYLPHPMTPLAKEHDETQSTGGQQVPNSESMTYKVLALTRITCPLANIPSTTAVATLNRTDGLELGLMRGANVVMPNVTPMAYRRLYEIYPDKACLHEPSERFDQRLRERIRGIGRTVGIGRGDSPRMLAARRKTGAGVA